MQAQTEEGAKTAEANRDWVQMQSLLISLRKCCNHPQLFGEWMGEVRTKLDEDLHLAYISPTSPLHLPYISPTSPLHLPHISPISPQYLPISPSRR